MWLLNLWLLLQPLPRRASPPAALRALPKEEPGFQARGWGLLSGLAAGCARGSMGRVRAGANGMALFGGAFWQLSLAAFPRAPLPALQLC